MPPPPAMVTDATSSATGGLDSAAAGMQAASTRDGRWTRLVRRFRVAPGVLRARREVSRATRVERRLLVALGDALAGATGQCGPDVALGLAAIDDFDSRRDGLRAAMARSLQDDCFDYGAVAAWIRPLVIGRGLASRFILRHRLLHLRRDREAACLRLGTALALASPDVSIVSGPIVNSVRDARSRIASATREEELLLAPVGGSLLPRPARLALSEIRAFGQAAIGEARTQLVPRMPALFGLVAGWWVTTTFTDSRFLATLHSLGIGSGPRRAVDQGTFRILSFCLPFLAAALCSYLTARLAALLRSRYGPGEATVPASPTPARGRQV